MQFDQVEKVLPQNEIQYAACNFSNDDSHEEAKQMTETFASRERGTFLMAEPRDQSLMRKAKVREILKTF